MEISKTNRYLGAELAATIEIEEKYRQLGYRVERECRIGDARFDLFVEKGEDKIVFEFKCRRLNKYAQNQIERLRKVAAAHGIRFKMVLVNVPSEKRIIVDEIEQTLLSCFLNKIPDELNSMAPSVTIDEVEEVTIDEIHIQSISHIEIKGSSDVIVDLLDDEHSIMHTMYCPFTFEGIWAFDDNGKLQLVELEKLNIDISKYFK